MNLITTMNFAPEDNTRTDVPSRARAVRNRPHGLFEACLTRAGVPIGSAGQFFCRAMPTLAGRSLVLLRLFGPSFLVHEFFIGIHRDVRRPLYRFRPDRGVPLFGEDLARCRVERVSKRRGAKGARGLHLRRALGAGSIFGGCARGRSLRADGGLGFRSSDLASGSRVGCRALRVRMRRRAFCSFHLLSDRLPTSQFS
jgi:hypothetical protein